MLTTKQCPKCGQPIPPDAPAGHCPHCLLAMVGRSEDLAADDPAAFASEERRFGDYVLGRQIGAGGMGIVYEAREASTNRQVAIKVIRDTYGASPVLLCRFTIETEAAARLNHPNIVRVHAVGESSGHPYFSMDFIAGESLGAKLTQKAFPFDWQATDGSDRGRRRLETIARLVIKIARAVHHAHERGVLHRDLKPGNILIDAKGEPHLTDFGLAKILQSVDEQRPMLTSAANFPGTPNYMSPEQVSGSETTRASDIYGLGAVLYESLTGKTLFGGPTPLEIFKQIVETEPARPGRLNPAVPADLETICLKCLEKDPRHRYISAEALAEDLENWLLGRPIKARTASLGRRVGRWTQRNPIGAALIISLCLGLSVSLTLYMKVRAQRDEIELDRIQTVEESMDKVRLIWQDPDVNEVTISARELAIIARRKPEPVTRARHQLSLGITTTRTPSAVAEQYARLLGQLQQELGKALGESVAFSLKMFKRYNPNDESLARGDADVLVLSAVDYLSVKEKVPGVVPIARAGTVREGVIFAHANAGARQLQDLAGKSLALTDSHLSLSVWAKARLLAAGLQAANFQEITNIVDQYAENGNAVVSLLETVNSVLKEEVDAGVSYRDRFERNKYRGLVMLDRFPVVTTVLAAREGLDPKIIEGLRKVVHVLKTKQSFDSGSHELSGAMVAVDDSYFDPLRKALKEAGRFEGHPAAGE